jgi:hypothetical protein
MSSGVCKLGFPIKKLNFVRYHLMTYSCSLDWIKFSHRVLCFVLWWRPSCISDHTKYRHMQNFIWIEPLLRSHPSYKATKWLLNTSLTVLAWTNYWNNNLVGNTRSSEHLVFIVQVCVYLRFVGRVVPNVLTNNDTFYLSIDIPNISM